MLDNGLGETSLRQLAKAAGVSDRMLLYYFDDKTDVLAEAMQAVAARFTVHLDQALPLGKQRAASDLFHDIAVLTKRSDLHPFMTIWIEAIASVARDTEPHRTIARQIADGFLDWIESRLPEGSKRRSDAAMVLTMIEGLTVILLCTDEATYESALSSLLQALSWKPPT